MDQYVIKGGNPLVGEVEIGGAKNAALAILAAAIMTDETVTVENLPDVRDTNVLLQAMEEIGAQVEHVDCHTVKINGSGIGSYSVDYEYIKRIRASYYLLGAMLGKYKRAEVPLPGGCNIGSRPIDQHLKGFKALGAEVKIEYGFIVAEAEHLRGSHIYLDVVSVGATINIMMAASMAEGNTVIENAAKEPHVVDVANFLNSMGANIKGAGTDVIRIRGVERLHATEYSIIPDQIEAGTFMFAAAVTKGDVTVKNVIPKHLEATTSKLLEIGCEIEELDDAVRVVCSKGLNPTNVKTLPYPGFPTDMQPQITVALGLARGTRIVTESIFENRFKGSYKSLFGQFGIMLRNRFFIRYILLYALAMAFLEDPISLETFLVKERYGFIKIVFTVCFGVSALGSFVDSIAALTVRTLEYTRCAGLVLLPL